MHLHALNKCHRCFLMQVEMGSETMVVRMTGCPNGCARPYMAELGFVGDGPNSYQLYVGGNSNQTRLADLYQERVKVKVGAGGVQARLGDTFR